MKFRFLILLLFPILFDAQHSVEVQPPPPISVDSVVADYDEKGDDVDSLLSQPYSTNNEVYKKKIKDNFRKKYKTEDFNYSEIKPKKSFWDRLMKRINEILQSIFGKSDPLKGNFARNLLYVIAVIIVGLVLYFLFKFLLDKEGNFIFGKKNKKNQIKVESLHENIHEINFAENIARYEQQKEYRMAIRYHFLQTLKTLEDKKLIHWNPEKTNHDYLVEIQNPNHQKIYDQLSYIFDYVWYGEFDIDEEKYQQFKEQFVQSKFS